MRPAAPPVRAPSVPPTSALTAISFQLWPPSTRSWTTDPTMPASAPQATAPAPVQPIAKPQTTPVARPAAHPAMSALWSSTQLPAAAAAFLALHHQLHFLGLGLPPPPPPLVPPLPLPLPPL